jgi:hypothetical protein
VGHEWARGERNGRAKLTAEQVIDIYLLARSKRCFQWQIGEAFGVSQSQVSLILHKREWRWLLLDNKGNEMMTDKDAEFEERLAASEKRVAELERQLRGEQPAPQFKREPQERYDPTANFGMPRSAVQAMAAAVPDRLMADLRADAAKPNPVTGTSQAQLTPQDRGGRVEIRGSGWANPNPLTTPAGVDICDRLVDAQDAIDAAERRKLFKE